MMFVCLFVCLFVLCLCKISKVHYVQTLRPTIFMKWITNTPYISGHTISD